MVNNHPFPIKKQHKEPVIAIQLWSGLSKIICLFLLLLTVEYLCPVHYTTEFTL